MKRAAVFAILSLLFAGGVGGLAVERKVLDDAPSDFNGNRGQLWLRSVAGDNGPRDATPDEAITNLFTACLDGDLYLANYSPGVGLDPNYIGVSLHYDYENWCPDDLSTEHDPFGEDS